MENLTKKEEVQFLTAKYYLKAYYGIDIQDEDFVEMGMVAYNEIGVENNKMFVYSYEIGEDYRITIPNTRVNNVLAVTLPAGMSDVLLDSLTAFDINYGFTASNYDDLKSIRDSSRRPVGEYLNYDLLTNNVIRINSRILVGSRVDTIFTVPITDSDGLPMINERVALAVAAEVAFMELKRRAYTGDQSAAQRLQLAEQEASRLMGRARIPVTMSDNTLDKILDVQVSHNRKVYNRSYKFTK